MKKGRLGFFKYSCCAGCEFQFMFFQSQVQETLSGFEFVYARMLRSGGNPEGPFDIALVEGTITESWQVDELKKIREQSTLLYAIGACAIDGGIPALKSAISEHDVQKRVYTDIAHIHSMRPHVIDEFVKVDGHIRGCPPGERDLHEALSAVLMGKIPRFIRYSVCIECKLKGNVCLLVAYNMPCMGPVTSAGCGAICPTYNRACYSCFGPMKHANGPALARKFRMMGLSRDDIIRKFTMFGAATIEFRRAIEAYED
jgi:coenzyme F420-reducing hydrogenase gamma subunit